MKVDWKKFIVDLIKLILAAILGGGAMATTFHVVSSL